MDPKKRASFVKKCGKKRQKFAKGGLVRQIGNRKYFQDGGTVLRGPSTSAVNQNAVNPNTGVLGTISNALGLNNQFQAGSALINPGTNTAQLNDAYTNAQTGLNNQAGIVTALQPQVPLAVQNQNALAEQELNTINGVGPNPALNQLNETTGKNIAATTSAMAGVRGASVNPALIAREAAQQGAQTQQQAVGQGATLTAQQQIAARDALTNLSNNQISQTGQAVTNQNTANQNEQTILQGANTAANNAAVGMQSNINNVNAATAAGNQNMQGKVLGGIASGVSSLTGGLFEEGGVVGEDGDTDPEHLKIAEMNAHSMNHVKKLKMAAGGAVPNLGASNYMQQGQQVGPSIQATSALPANENDFAADVNKLKKKPEAPTTTGEAQPWDLGGGLAGSPSDVMDNGSPLSPGGEMGLDGGGLEFAAHGGMMKNYCAGPHDSHVANFLHGGKVEAMVSPGEIYLSPEQVTQVIHEDADPAKVGMKIKGRAKVKGDSLQNDTVPMDLEAGGVVVDRKNMSTKEKRQLFVHRAIARKKARA